MEMEMLWKGKRKKKLVIDQTIHVNIPTMVCEG